MKLEEFTQVIDTLQKESDTIGDLYQRKVDLIEFVDPYHSIITLLITEIYGEEGHDWFSWFCYENDFGKKKMEAWDENENPICYDVESLWRFLEEIKEKL